MPDDTCPSCGNRLPPEMAIPAQALEPGVVACPHCGASVAVAKEPAPDASGEPETVDAPAGESFAGHETLEGVMDEVRDKEDG